MTPAPVPSADRNARSFDELSFALRHTQGHFKLLFGHCNYRRLRRQTSDRLLAEATQFAAAERAAAERVAAEMSEIPEMADGAGMVPFERPALDPQPRPQILELQVEPDTTSLLPSLLECAMTQPYAVIVSDLEIAANVRSLFDDLNQRRELLRDRCPFPIVFWLDDRLLSSIVRHVPDLASWATTYTFDIEPEQLVEQIERFCDRVFERVMTPDPDRFLARYSLLRDRDRLELDLGLRRLRRNGDRLTPQLRANVHFATGRRAYECGKFETAANYFRQSLNYWVSLSHDRAEPDAKSRTSDLSDTSATTSSSSSPHLEPYPEDDREVTDTSLDPAALSDIAPRSLTPNACIPLDSQPPTIQWASKQGVLWTHLGLCQLQGDRETGNEWRARLMDAAQSLRRAIFSFKDARRPELNAATLVFLAQVLYELEAWKALKNVLRQAIDLHAQHGTSIRLAVDYLMLAEIAAREQRWPKVQAWSVRTVRLLQPQLLDPELSTLPFWPGLVQLADLYQALAAQQRNKTQQIAPAVKRAIAHLPATLNDRAHAIDPAYYLQLLEQLRVLYFGLGYYREALQFVLKYRSIAQQYGFQAFVGIGQLQAQRDTAPLQPDSAASPSTHEAVSREIYASGRERDIRGILDLLIRPDRKLIAIHGQSGVGKSSLVNAGLVPTLRRTSISGRVVVPIVLSVYADWPDRLARQLGASLVELGYESSAVLEAVPETTPSSATGTMLPEMTIATDAERILEAVQDLTGNRLALVFIFDQFEEFFFANAEPSRRERFYQFLDRLLSFPFVKAALLLRDDCLHLLLECDRLLSMDVTQGDILKQTSRYYVGNFSREEARNLICTLTNERSAFNLDTDLIEELVRDLSETRSEVRPIELQIVGTQLQQERITSLAQYRERGPKAALVRRFLVDSIGYCGPENETAALAVLFCLTDKNGTRPIRTRADLAQAIDIPAEPLDGILHILCDSGLIFTLADVPAYRYQLVHDYLVPFIRQEQERHDTAETEALRQENRQLNQDKELLEQLAEARERRQISEQTSRRLLAIGAIVSTLGAIAFGTLANVAHQARQRAEFAERQTALAAVDARNSAARALWLADDSLNAIVDALRATIRLTSIPELEVSGTSKYATSKDFGPYSGGFHNRETLSYTTLQTLNPLLQSATERNRLEGHSNSILGVEFAPNGQFLVSASWDESLRVWTARGDLQYQVPKAHRDAVTTVTITPDSQTIVTGGHDRAVKLWNAEDGIQVADLKGHVDIVASVAVSPDGRWLASAGLDGLVILWDLQRRVEVRRFQAHNDWAMDVAFAPNGGQLATVSRDRTLRLWKLDGQFEAEFVGHSSGLTSVDFSPDGESLVTASADGTAIVWTREGEEVVQLTGHDGWVLDARFSPDGTTIATADDRHVTLWNRDGSKRAQLEGHRDRIWSLSFNPRSSTLASSSTDNTVRLWETQPRALLTGSASISSVAVSQNGRAIATAQGDRVVRLYTPMGEERQQLEGHTAKVLTVAFAPDDAALVSAAEDGTARIWDRDTGRERAVLTHGGRVQLAAFSSDGTTVATAGDDGIVRLWDARTGIRQRTLYGHTDRAIGLAFDPRNELLVTASSDNTVRLWTRTGDEIATLHGHESSVNWVAFSPDGDRIASASADNTIRVWQRDGTPIVKLVGHTGPVNGVAFSESGRELVSVSDDRTLRFWNANGRALLAFEAHDDRVLSVAIGPNTRILTAGSDRRLRAWSLDAEDSIVGGCRWVKPYLDGNPSVTPENRQICDGFVR